MTSALYTDFLTASPKALAQLATTDAVLAALVDAEPSVGGIGFAPERLDALIQILGITPPPQIQRLTIAQAVTVRIYLLPTAFCAALASADHEALLDASAAWSDSSAWRATPMNPFDVAGFLIELQQLCRAAERRQQNVYLIMSQKPDWQPQRIEDSDTRGR